MANIIPLEDAVRRAFVCMYWEDAGSETYYEAFASHWGGLELEHMRRAFEVGKGEEKVLAIFALGLTATEEMADLLAPLLNQAPCMERWASAICLGLMKDVRAFPVLESLLLEGLGLEEYSRTYVEEYPYTGQEELSILVHEQNWYATYRWYAIQLLEGWDSPTLLSTLKQTYVALWRIQQHLLPFRWFDVSSYDALAYSLGLRGDFTFLHALDVPSEFRNRAMIYLILGHLHVQASSGSELTGLSSQISGLTTEMLMNDTLREAVAVELGSHFGLSPAEQEECLDRFYDDGHRCSLYGHPQNDENVILNYEDDGEEIDNEEVDDEEVKMLQSQPLCMYQEHTAQIQSFACSPTSTHIVSGSGDTTARVWNSVTGETVTVFRGHNMSVNLVSWSPQGRWIASGSSDRVVYIWDAWTGEQVRAYRGHQSWIWGGLAWSPDGTKIASASLDGTVQVWDAFSGATVLTYRGHTGMIASLTWSPDGTRIASGGGYPECAIHVWDAQTGVLQLTYRDHQRDEHKQRPLFGLILQEYDEGTEKWLREASSVHGLAWSPDGMYLASAGLRTVCRVWNARSGENIVASNRADGPLAWSPDGRFLSSISAEDRHRVDIWHSLTNQSILSYRVSGMYELKAVAWSPNGQFLAASGSLLDSFGKDAIQVWRAIS